MSSPVSVFGPGNQSTSASSMTSPVSGSRSRRSAARRGSGTPPSAVERIAARAARRCAPPRSRPAGGRRRARRWWGGEADIVPCVYHLTAPRQPDFARDAAPLGNVIRLTWRGPVLASLPSAMGNGDVEAVIAGLTAHRFARPGIRGPRRRCTIIARNGPESIDAAGTILRTVPGRSGPLESGRLSSRRAQDGHRLAHGQFRCSRSAATRSRQSSASRATRSRRCAIGAYSGPDAGSARLRRRVSQDIVAVYDDKRRTIYLPEEWTGETPAEMSVLVHEMVHHLQNEAYTKFPCPQAREQLAYAAQQRWLEAHGRTLEDEFRLDPMTLLVTTRCM